MAKPNFDLPPIRPGLTTDEDGKLHLYDQSTGRIIVGVVSIEAEQDRELVQGENRRLAYVEVSTAQVKRLLDLTPVPTPMVEKLNEHLHRSGDLATEWEAHREAREEPRDGS